MKNITFKPTVFWAWNSQMTEEQIKRDLKAFSEQKIGGVFVHARAGLRIPYLGTEWFKAYRITIEECKKYGIEVWIYDEQGWPSGFAGGAVSKLGEEYSLKYLALTNKKEEVDFSRLIQTYQKKDNKWIRCSLNDAQYYVYYKTEPHYVDLLNPAVTEAFINSTHELYKLHFAEEFGKTIKGVFTDEPQIHVSSLAWSIALPEAFKLKSGYEVFDGLPLLFEETDEAKKFRFDYYQTVRELFVNNYTKRINDWCRENNLILTGHFAGEEGLCVQVASNTGVMPHYEYMDLAGIDSLGRRLNSVLLMKQIESVASQFGRNRILSETFACTGNGVSFAELKMIWGYHLSFGVNLPCMSISMPDLSGIRKRDYPVFISYQQPWWNYFHYFSEWVERTGKLTNLGKYSAEVLLLSSVNSALYEPIFSYQQKIASANFRKLAEMLINLQVEYDIGDETLLAKYGKVISGRLKLKNGSYHTVILPEQTGINRSTLELLVEFKKQGGKIIQIQSFPNYIDGKRTDEAKKILFQICDVVLQEREGILEKYFTYTKLSRKIHVVNKYGKTQKGLIVRVRQKEKRLLFSIFNKTNTRIEAFIKTEAFGSFFEIDTLEETSKNITLYANDTNSVGKLTIEGYEFKVFEFIRDVKINYHNESNDNVIIEKTMKFKRFTDENILALDYATYEIDSLKIDKPIPVIKILDTLFNLVEEKGQAMDAKISYEFLLETKTPLGLSVEMGNCQKIIVNQHTIWDITKPLPNEYLRDHSLVKFDITSFVKENNNKIDIIYKIEPMNLGFKVKEVHDVERNRFSYQTTIETIYLSGNFDVQNLGNFQEDEKAITVEGPFKIVDTKPKTTGDVISQNRYFYAGNLEYVDTLVYQDGKIKVLPDFYGTAAVIFVNGVEAGLSDGINSVDITNLLKPGNNNLSVIILGNLRNMLGPHHHISKEPEFTGINTFTGDYGKGAVEDLSNDGQTEKIITDSYHFIRQGLKKIKIIKY